MNLDSFEDILTILDKLQGVKAPALVFFVCLGIGYIWRGLNFKWFPNESIPVAVMGIGALAMSLIADGRPNSMPQHVWIVRNFLIGLVIGVIAWAAHNYVISKLEMWLVSKFPAQLGNTTFLTKPDPLVQPQPSKEPSKADPAGQPPVEPPH